MKRIQRNTNTFLPLFKALLKTISGNLSYNKKMIKCFYYAKGNYGDILSPFLIKNLFGIDLKHVVTISHADLFAIGSILEKIEEAKATLAVWGSGFMYGPEFSGNPGFINTWSGPQKFLAVRGKMSASRIENFNGVLGDPGLLVSRMSGYDAPIEKKYKIGFVPHYIDRHLDYSKKIRELPDVHYIEIMQDPSTFIKEIQKCEYVISSSLHGLVTADAYHIPNLHIQLSDGVFGKNYKYKDYYSVWDLQHKFVDLRDCPEITEGDIIGTINQNYIDKDIVNIQDNLIRVFKEYYGC